MRNLQEISNKIQWKLADRFVVPLIEKIPRLMREHDRMKLMHTVSKRRFNKYLQQKMGHFAIDIDPGPPAPKELILKTAVLKQEDVEQKAKPDFYLMSGYSQVLSWLRILDRNGFNLRTAAAIMELGCGSGRLIRHLRCLDGVRLVGTDLDGENIEWCRENLPGIEFYRNELYPPLQFAESNSFDLIYAVSVFTHIPLEAQKPWIEEMHRVLRPGGFFMADVLGRCHQVLMLNVEDMKNLRSEGHLVLNSEDPKASLSTKVIGSWDVFQTRSQILDAFRSRFHVHDFIPTGLDLLVMQKPYSRDSVIGRPDLFCPAQEGFPSMHNRGVN